MKYQIKLADGTVLSYDGATWVTPSSKLTTFLNNYMKDDIMDLSYQPHPDYDKVKNVASVLGGELIFPEGGAPEKSVTGRIY
ncbi:MAG: hypothetical protein WC965_02140 [Thiohalomonadaceae bacterium]